MTARPVRTTLIVTALLALVLSAVGLGSAPPVAAHEGPGILTVETDEPTPTGHRYVIRLVWQNDGHPAARDTTITATPYDPSGAPQTPIPMTPVDGDGRFEATVDMPQPGSWRVQFASVSPVASVDHPAEVAAPATTAPPAPSTSARVADDAATEAAATDAAAPGRDTADGGDGGGSGVLVAAVVVLVVLVAAGVVLFLRRRTALRGG
jgi:hypothetical protein